MRSILRRILICAALISINLRADIITLTDGRTVEGDIVSESPDEIVVKVAIGKTTIKREEIQSIEKRKSAAAVMRDKMDALLKDSDKSTPAAWLVLAAEAQKKGARDEAQKAYSQVLKLDPDNETARRQLGFVKANEQWISKSDVNEQAKSAAPAAPAVDTGSGAMTREKLAAAAGVAGFSPAGEKPVNCPRCNGTGVWIMLPCLNCAKSDKPGYKMLGDRYELDQRCNGTGKNIGAYCELCSRTGKVLMSRIAPAEGGQKKAPPGMKWCPTCSGTGIEKFLPCNQCKRSKWPGYLYLGDQIIVCNSCGGSAKKAALDCEVCKKTGLVKAD